MDLTTLNFKIMTNLNDILQEMTKVRAQLSLLRHKKKKSFSDIEEMLILMQYHDILLSDYITKTNKA